MDYSSRFKSTAEQRAASVLPHFALEKELICVHSLAKQSGFEEQTARPIWTVLRRFDWVEEGWRQLSHGSKGLHTVSHLTPKFWEDTEQLHKTLTTNLDDTDLDLYQSAIDARTQLPRGQETNKDLRTHAVTYLGGIAVLSERLNLKDFGIWVGADEGWKALVTIQAFKPMRAI
jgi:hypothetical protein